jgi:HD domain-containing protein
MLPPDQARQVLANHSPTGEVWPAHCRQVARIARMVALSANAAGAEVMPDSCESMALVHDIGRSITHGPLHGWEGFQLMDALGHPGTGRGCLTHWLKGREPEELLESGFEMPLIEQAYNSLIPREWQLEDSIVSFADSSVAGAQVVPLQTRHADLSERYGASVWLDRHLELGLQHAQQISDALGHPVTELLKALY